MDMFSGNSSRDDREVFSSHLNPNYTFERFVKGPSNEYAYMAALGAAQNPMTYHNPLYLFGGVGLGKTHLMMAIGNYILKNNPSLKVLYVPSETFQNEIVEAVKNKSASYQKKYRNVDILLIDDIQFISEKAAYTQEQIFHIFNHLYQNNKQIVISGDRPPQQLATLKDRLISRFQSGLIVDIKPPNLETREAILQSKSVEMGIDVPKEVIRFIATHEKGQVRLLEAALIKLQFSSQLKHKKVDMELASEIIREISFEMESHLNAENIIKIVSREMGIKTDQILGKSRVESIVWARHSAMYLVRKCIPSITLLEVAHAFARNDHTTVMNAEKKVRQKMDSDSHYKEFMDKVLDIILSKTV
jgi:chromosomal replication initiator protein